MRKLAAIAAGALIATPALPAAAAPPPGLDKIQHILVIYLENHSFDNLFGLFPGAEGLSSPEARKYPQVDASGKQYDILPRIIDTSVRPPLPDARFPRDLRNEPFLIDKYVSQSEKIPDIWHRYFQNQMQIDVAMVDGKLVAKNDKFAAYADSQGMTMGHYDAHNTELWKYASEFTLLDHFFIGAFGGSFLNHQWLICACTPVYPEAPAKLRAKINGQGLLDNPFTDDGSVTAEPDLARQGKLDGNTMYYAVNTLFPVFTPHPAGKTIELVPPQTHVTIGDRLSAKNVDWAWYSGGWSDAVAGKPDELFQFHHQPFAYYVNYGDNSVGRAHHLKDAVDLYGDIKSGKLPPVAFFKPIGEENEHPGYANLTNGDTRATDVIDHVRASPLWDSTLIIVTYDDFGGFWDHAPPPSRAEGGDEWGPGTRIPTILIGPFAKQHTVDSAVSDTTAILRLIEERFGVDPVGAERSFIANPDNDLREGLDLK